MGFPSELHSMRGNACDAMDELDEASPSVLCMSVVVLGAAGDLARKKTYPALFQLFKKVRCQQVVFDEIHIIFAYENAWFHRPVGGWCYGTFEHLNLRAVAQLTGFPICEPGFRTSCPQIPSYLGTLEKLLQICSLEPNNAVTLRYVKHLKSSSTGSKCWASVA
eukprot:4817514-Pyramimonas_sp.AAC.1